MKIVPPSFVIPNQPHQAMICTDASNICKYCKKKKEKLIIHFNISHNWCHCWCKLYFQSAKLVLVNDFSKYLALNIVNQAFINFRNFLFFIYSIIGSTYKKKYFFSFSSIFEKLVIFIYKKKNMINLILIGIGCILLQLAIITNELVKLNLNHK